MPRKGENIYKRKDHRWEARYIRGRRADGKALYGYCYGKTYKEVKQKLQEAKSNQGTVSEQESRPMEKTFGDCCAEWLQLTRNRVKESTYVKYAGIMEKYILPRFGEGKTQELSSVSLEQFSHDLLHKNGLACKTVRDILGILHSAMKYACKQCQESTVEIVYPKNVIKDIRVLSPIEQRVFTRYLLRNGDLYKFGTLLSLMTGIRIGELCALRWLDISLEEEVIRVCATMQRIQSFDPSKGTKTKVIISQPKSRTSARIVPLTKQALALCRLYQCDDPNAFVLTGTSDRFCEPRAMQYRMQKYVSECHLDGVHFHTLRHTFATRCVEVDFEIKTLSEIMGHSSPKITLEKYVHSSLQLKKDNMNKLTAAGW